MSSAVICGVSGDIFPISSAGDGGFKVSGNWPVWIGREGLYTLQPARIVVSTNRISVLFFILGIFVGWIEFYLVECLWIIS